MFGSLSLGWGHALQGLVTVAVLGAAAWEARRLIVHLPARLRATAELDDEERAGVEFEVRGEAMAWSHLLPGLARLAMASGFLVGLSEIAWLYAGDRGLLGLQAGLAERRAVEAILGAVVIAAVTSFGARAVHGRLQRARRELLSRGVPKVQGGRVSLSETPL